MKFTRVTIDRFFNLRDVDLDLTSGNTLIVGPNGSGKTNIIKCIHFLVNQILNQKQKVTRQPLGHCRKSLLDSRGLSEPFHDTASEIWNPNEDCFIEITAHFNKFEVELFSELRVLCLMADVCDFVLAITQYFLNKIIVQILQEAPTNDHLQASKAEEITRDKLIKKKLFCGLPESTFMRMISLSLSSTEQPGSIRRLFNNISGSGSCRVELDSLLVSSLCVEVTNKLFRKLLTITRRALSDCQDKSRPDEGSDVVLKACAKKNIKDLEYSIDVKEDAWLPVTNYRAEEHECICSTLCDIFGKMEGVEFSVQHTHISSWHATFVPFNKAIQGLFEYGHKPVGIFVRSVNPILQGSFIVGESSYRGWLMGTDILLNMLQSTDWGILYSSCLTKLQRNGQDTIRPMNKKEFLQFSARICLQKSTVNCILPQIRDVVMEHDELVLNLKSMEQLLIKSKLSDCSDDEVVQKQLSKVKNGMKSFCGIKIGIQQKQRAVAECNEREAQDSDSDSDSDSQTQIQTASSWTDNLRVMVTRTLWSEDTSYSHMTPLSGLSGGEIEILMVLCTIHLSGADTVFLDEPGHSLHPPQQAQLCRWIETLQHPDPVCVLVTHSVEFISRKSLNSLYHMSFVKTGFTPFKLSADSTGEKQHSFPMDESLVAASPSASSVSSTEESKETVPVEQQADLEEGTSTLAQLTSVTAITNPSPKLSVSTQEVTLSKEIVSMLMRPDMRKMFFATGLYFVEGETDKVVLSAVRQHLLKNARDTLEMSKNRRDVLRAVRMLEMDQWDILALGGCAEAMKAYRAAAELRIPCAIVLDIDTITVKHGKRVEPFTSKTWTSSRLYKALTKERQRNSLEVAPLLLDKVDAVFAEGRTQEEPLSETRKILQEYGFWIWEGDLESVVCDNPAARQQLLTTECFMEALGEDLHVYLSVSGRCSMPTEAALDNYDIRILAPLVPLVDELRAELDAARARLCENPSQRVTEDMQNLVGKIGKFKQPLKKHDDFCEKGTKRKADWPTNHKGSTKKSAGDPCRLVHSHQDDVSMNSETTQPPADEGATGGLSYEQESDREKIMWDRIKHKLHNEGGWMKLPWETLCKVVEVCLKEDSSPLQDFCRFTKKWQCKGKKKINYEDLPRSLLSKLYEDDAED